VSNSVVPEDSSQQSSNLSKYRTSQLAAASVGVLHIVLREDSAKLT
jgi:hypothetical protein